MIKKTLFILALHSFFITIAQKTYTVSSLTEFNTALTNVVSGDTIEWLDGSYTNVFMDITVAGITVKAETPGGVIFNGSSRVEIDVDADNVTFTGFQYIGGDIGTNHVARIYGSNVLFENVNISEYISYKYLIVQDESQYTTIKKCNFEHRVNNPDQNILSILVSSTQPGYHKIQYSSFKNFDGEEPIGDAGVEPIRIGVSSTADYASKSIVEYCYFTDCDGDGEIISHKAKECIYRYNTFEGNPNSELVLRHGDNGIVYGNFFYNNMGGVRIQEASGHVIFNNYFNNLSSRSVYLRDDDSDPLENILVAYNTFVNTESVLLSGGGDTQEPTNVTLANNIFSNINNGIDLLDDATGNEVFLNNIVNGSLGITAPNSGISVENPEISLNSEGFYSIASSSSAINSGQTGYPTLPNFTELTYDSNILLDVLLTTRPATETLKDIGCQEFSSESIVQPHVTEENTGPDYLNDSTLSTNNLEGLIIKNFNVYPNPLVEDTINFSFKIKEKSKLKVTIYDFSGRKIKSLINSKYDIGNYNFNEIINLKPGLYLLQIELLTEGKLIKGVEKIIKK